MRQASSSDTELLVRLMSDFYAESGYDLDPRRAAQAFRDLMADDRLGRIWLLEAEGRVAGYLVVTLGYSMEYGGLDAFVDDLYVIPEARGAGLGTAALERARAFCVARGVRALHLEMEPGNAVARSLYQKVGFESSGRELLTLRFASSSHAV